MSKKKIGFGSYGDDDQEPEEDLRFLDFIETNYSTEGDVEDMEFRTATELQYELNEIMYVSTIKINDTLKELGFGTKFIEGVPNWVLYKRALTSVSGRINSKGE